MRHTASFGCRPVKVPGRQHFLHFSAKTPMGTLFQVNTRQPWWLDSRDGRPRRVR
jgi:hypothetical protein